MEESFKLEPKEQQPIKKLEQVFKLFPPVEVPNDAKRIEMEDFVTMKQNVSSDDYSPEDISYVEKEEPIEEIPLDAVFHPSLFEFAALGSF